MTTEYPIDWLLDCEPRPSQLEALSRSYLGVQCRDHKDEEPRCRPLAGISGDRMNGPNEGPLKGWGHFLEMRLGKTPLALNEYMLLKRDHGIKRLLVFSPNKYAEAWGKEAVRFGVDVPIQVLSSKRRKDAAKFLDQIKREAAMLVVPYEALISEANHELIERFMAESAMVAADESAQIKNRTSFQTTHATALTSNAQVWRVLSGKPVVQGPHDLYSQFRFLRYLDGMSFYSFRGRFCTMGGFQGKKIVGVKNEERLNKLRSAMSFFARRVDWGTFIEPDYDARPVDMSSVQKKAYREMEEDFVLWLNENDSVTADHAAAKHIKLQQISSGFILDENRTANWLIPPDKVPKTMDLLELLRTEVPGKTFIVCHHNATIDALMGALAEFNPAVIRGTRGMNLMDRDIETEKARFNGDRSCRVILGQEKSAKYGHNLMGSIDVPCLTTVYYENSYSLDDRAQTEQRNQGEGQQKGIHIVDYFSSPVERAIVQALQHKEDVAAKVMGYYKAML